MSFQNTFEAVLNELEYQVLKWGEQHHPIGNSFTEFHKVVIAATRAADKAARDGTLTWYEILREEFYEAFAEEENSYVVNELVQIIAVCFSIIRDIEQTDGIDYAKQLPNRAEIYRKALREKTVGNLRKRSGSTQTSDSEDY